MTAGFILFILIAQIVILGQWMLSVQRRHDALWSQSQVKHFVFLIVLFGAVTLHVLVLSDTEQVPPRFAAMRLLGSVLVKLGFIISLGARLAYIFLGDTSNEIGARRLTRMLHALTGGMLLGLLFFSVQTYVWLSELLLLPAGLFLYSFRE